MPEKVSLPDVTVTAYGLSDVGVVRTNNEDSFLVAELGSGKSGLVPEVLRHKVSERGTLLVVSDGMGGAEAGEVASRIVVEQLETLLRTAPADTTGEEIVRQAVERVNYEVWNVAQQYQQYHGMGATLAAAWIRGPEVLITGVGDSRVYLLRAGKMKQITRDQSMVESLVEVGMLNRNEAEQHPQRNVILQAMGSRPEVVVAIERLELRKGDFLLLCSDGLSGKITGDEMRDCVLTTAALPEGCHRMIQLAKQRGGEDNITVVVAEVDGPGLNETTLNERMTRTLQSITEFNFRTGGGYAPITPHGKPTVTLGAEDNGETNPLVVPAGSRETSEFDSTHTLASPGQVEDAQPTPAGGPSSEGPATADSEATDGPKE